VNSLLLFSSDLERDAAFPGGLPGDLLTGITGVGLIEAAIGTARLLDRHHPPSVIFLGTCGAHRESGIAIGEIVVASEVTIGSGDVARGSMRIPTLMAARLAADASLSDMILDAARRRGGAARKGTVSCTLGITEDDELARSLNASGSGEVENLEAFSVVRACEDIPVAVVLGVTNIVGSGGGRDWAANYRAMMRAVAELVVDVRTNAE
jgi:adenosylhomocysteine nucleosidase